MLYQEIIIPLLLGVFTGVLNGITGVMNMVIILASLSFLKVIKEYNTVVGTGMYILLFPVTVFAAMEYYKHEKINFFVGNLVVIGLMIGSYFGAWITFHSDYALTEKTIKFITGIIGLCLSIFYLYTAYRMK